MPLSRRHFLAGLSGLALSPSLSAIPASPADDPWPDWVAVGDVRPGYAVVASQCRQGGAMQVEWSLHADLSQATRLVGPEAGPATGYTSQLEVADLPGNSLIYYRVSFPQQAPLRGIFRTPPEKPGMAVRFVWGGDVCGQGWGIDEQRGGMQTFASMNRVQPHFFVHSGDSVYADSPLPAEKRLDDGSLWRNLVTPSKSRPALSLDDFRGNQRYNLIDGHYRNFLSRTGVVAQWDDHEVCDNWEPVRDRALAGRARQAFLEYWPMQGKGVDRVIYRRVSYGPDLDVFVLDLRSYRGPNSGNRQPKAGPETALLGRTQLNWLKKSLQDSRATWKFISGEMPIATYTPAYGLDSWANGPGPPLGRELELAELLRHVRDQRIHNVVWLSADVHYAAALHYQPERATFKEFSPFWEFIAGPLHAGTFPPTLPLDSTFGVQLDYCAVPPDLKPNRPPSQGMQFFGQVDIAGRHCQVSLHRQDGLALYKKTLQADG